MAVAAQLITDQYAIYNGDCIEVMATLPTGKITCRSIPLLSEVCITIPAAKRT